jgi:hypothetical protein
MARGLRSPPPAAGPPAPDPAPGAVRRGRGEVGGWRAPGRFPLSVGAGGFDAGNTQAGQPGADAGSQTGTRSDGQQSSKTIVDPNESSGQQKENEAAAAGWRREERRRAGEEVLVGAEEEVRRERKGAGWAEEGRRGVGGLVERGSGAVWRYAGCLCGLSRGLTNKI